MSLVLRMVLIVMSILTTAYMMRKIRSAKVQIEDVIFWISLSILLIIMSVFPSIPAQISRILGIMAPVNFLFLFMIFILMVKVFSMSLKISELESKLGNLAQEIAIRSKEEEEDEKTCE